SVPVTGRYGVSALKLVRSGALAGLGIANVPEFLVCDDVTAGRLVRLLPQWTIAKGAIHMVYPTSQNLSPRVRTFVDFITTEFAEHRPWESRPSFVRHSRKR